MDIDPAGAQPLEQAVKYLLTILANGRPQYFERMAASLRFLDPQPSAVYVYSDGPGPQPPAESVEPSWTLESSNERLGMCKAHSMCWQAARESDLEWVFHIEEDQVLLRPVKLNDLAETILHAKDLLQMALVRCPWGAEIEHGGYIPQSPSHYTRREAYGREWIETTRNWATSPALFRTDFARAFAWPIVANCESAFGPIALTRYEHCKFGLWGAGEPFSAHIGVEKAEGATGY